MAARHEWAASFIARGLSVLILHDVSAGQCSCLPRWDGKECKPGSQGKHPRARVWQNAGITSMAQIRAELDEHPFANLGILTGPASGVWVLDVDPRHDGHVRLAELIEQFGPLPSTYTVRTGSGGQHYYWLLPDDFGVTNANRLPVGLDTRGAGGQVVAPGSVTLFGSYSVELDTPPVQAPEWLLALVRPAAVTESPGDRVRSDYPPGDWAQPAGEVATGEAQRLRAYAAAAVSRELAALERSVPGSRGSTAFRTACALIELCNSPWAGLSPALVRAAYDRAAEVAMALGGSFDEAEASQSWDSAARRVGYAGRAEPAGLDAGGVVPGIDFTTSPAAGVPPFGDAAGIGGLANPFALPQQRSSEHDVSELRASVGLLDPEVARRVRQIEVDAQAKAIVRARAEASGEAEARRAALREQMVSAAQLALMPGPEPLIAGLLNIDTTAWMIGKSGTYKSFVALDMACHVARGMEWQGRKVTQGKVVYIVAEGARGMSLRVRAWEARHGPIGPNLIFLPRPVSVADEQAWGDLVAVVTEIKPVFIIGDTQARLSIGIQENDNTEMMRYVEAVDALRRPTGACVLTVHHIGRVGTDARGASSIDGAQDTELKIERTGTRALRIHQDKQKDSEDETALDLLLELEGESLVVGAAALVNPTVGGRPCWTWPSTCCATCTPPVWAAPRRRSGARRLSAWADQIRATSATARGTRRGTAL
jgi:hypothetical protein